MACGRVSWLAVDEFDGGFEFEECCGGFVADDALFDGGVPVELVVDGCAVPDAVGVFPGCDERVCGGVAHGRPLDLLHTAGVGDPAYEAGSAPAATVQAPVTGELLHDGLIPAFTFQLLG